MSTEPLRNEFDPRSNIHIYPIPVRELGDKVQTWSVVQRSPVEGTEKATRESLLGIFDSEVKASHVAKEKSKELEVPLSETTQSRIERVERTVGL